MRSTDSFSSRRNSASRPVRLESDCSRFRSVISLFVRPVRISLQFFFAKVVISTVNEHDIAHDSCSPLPRPKLFGPHLQPSSLHSSKRDQPRERCKWPVVYNILAIRLAYISPFRIPPLRLLCCHSDVLFPVFFFF